MQCADIFKVLKEKTNSIKIPISCKSEGEIKIFPDKQNLRALITTRSAIGEMLKVVLQVEVKEHQAVT